MRKLSIVILSLVFVPQSVFAISASDALRVRDDEVVTRGDFIRAAVQVLNLENLEVDQRKDLPYRRVASGYEPFIRVAHKKNALEAFGYDLLLGQGISRGDALRVVVNLTGLDTASPAAFSDVRIGTPEERAVRVAIARSWMEPLRENLFGVRRKLTGREALILLRKAAGEEEVQSSDFQTNAPTIKFNLETNKRLMNLPKTQILEAIWSAIEREFLYTDDIDTDEAAWKAAEGLVESLGDKYTTFMRPVRAKQFQSQINGELTGIGAQVEHVDNVLTVVSPIVGSPAEAAGLEPGDQILKVNGEDLAGLSFLEAVEHVRGPKGSTAKLTINRDGVVFDVDVMRDIIKVPEATISWQGDVLVVKISQFGRITDTELRANVQSSISGHTPKGFVLDLRKNPGGLLDAADTVISMFVPKNTAFVEVRRRKEKSFDYTTKEQIIADSIPVAVLIDEGSASASEIVAGALQDLDRATVIGAKSFGKGTVQQVMQFTDQSSLK
ncbi:MAG: PDZ domain-containing protein, partial [Candidatus Peregrinibacteria bacterium]|nr:PDZ domain-containing protein [Candidatus Peregrinibacteria bacterium]